MKVYVMDNLATNFGSIFENTKMDESSIPSPTLRLISQGENSIAPLPCAGPLSSASRNARVFLAWTITRPVHGMLGTGTCFLSLSPIFSLSKSGFALKKLTMPQAYRLIGAALTHGPAWIRKIIAEESYRMRRNFVAYQSYRKKRLLESG
ncbi:MAG: hypothetical protein QXI12_06440 [Candidatus Methanomethyliaceae archaeon]